MSIDIKNPEDKALYLADQLRKAMVPGSSPVRNASFFGLVASEDGRTSDQAAKLLDALESGYVFDGQGLSYNFEGDLWPDAGSFKGIRNAKLRCKVRGEIGRNLFLRGQSSFLIENLHMVGDGGFNVLPSGAGDNPAMFWADNNSNFDIKNLKASNGGPGSGIRISECSDFNIYSPTVFGMRWELTGMTNDVIDCIAFLHNKHMNVFGSRVFDITGNNFGLHTPDGGHPDTPLYTRGLATGDNPYSSFIGGAIRGVDQGVDVTAGAAGPDDYTSRITTFQGIQVSNTQTWGFKFANVMQDMAVANCISSYSKNAGFTFGPPTSHFAPDAQATSRITLTNCGAYNPGSDGVSRPFGFNLGSEAIYPSYVQGINLVDCWALDDRGAGAKMTRGAFNETVHDGSDAFLGNKLTRFRSLGHTEVASLGFHEPYVCLSGLSGDLGPVANDVAAGTSINFDPSNVRAFEAEDSMKMHSTPSNKQNFYVREEGVYEIRARVVFAAQATAVGIRRAVLIYDGNNVLPTETIVAPINAQKCAVNINHMMRMTPGKVLLLSAYQNSGGVLNYHRDYGLMAIRKISD